MSTCTCRTGYVGEFCEMTTVELKNISEVRSLLIETLQIVPSAVDIDSTLLSTLMTAVNILSKNHLQLNNVSTGSISSMILSFIDIAESLQLPYSDVSQILTSVDDLTKSVNAYNTVLSVTPGSLLKKYSTYVLSQMSLLQNDEIFMYDTFKMIMGFKSVTNNSVTLTTPLSSTELESGTVPNTISLLTSDNTVNARISLLLMKQYTLLPILRKDIHSNPITVIVPNITICGPAGCTVSIVLQTVDNTTYTKNIPTLQKFVTQCDTKNATRNATKTIVYSCVNGFTVTAKCDGLSSYNITSYCPYVSTSPNCGILTSTSSNNDVCKLVSYNDKQTVCQCTVPNSILSSSNRRLNYYENENQNENKNDNKIKNILDEKMMMSREYNMRKLLTTTGGFQIGTTTVSTTITPPALIDKIPSSSPTLSPITIISTSSSGFSQRNIIIVASVIPGSCLICFLLIFVICKVKNNKDEKNRNKRTAPYIEDKSSDGEPNFTNIGSPNPGNEIGSDNDDENKSDSGFEDVSSFYDNDNNCHPDSTSGFNSASGSGSSPNPDNMNAGTVTKSRKLTTVSSWTSRVLLPRTNYGGLNLTRKPVPRRPSVVASGPLVTEEEEQKEIESGIGIGSERERGRGRYDEGEEKEYVIPFDLDGDEDIEVRQSNQRPPMTLSVLFGTDYIDNIDDNRSIQSSNSTTSSGKYVPDIRTNMRVLPVHRMSYRDPIPDAESEDSTDEYLKSPRKKSKKSQDYENKRKYEDEW